MDCLVKSKRPIALDIHLNNNVCLMDLFVGLALFLDLAGTVESYSTVKRLLCENAKRCQNVVFLALLASTVVILVCYFHGGKTVLEPSLVRTGDEHFEKWLHERVIAVFGSFNVVFVIFAVGGLLQDKYYLCGFVVMVGCGAVFVLVGVYYLMGEQHKADGRIPPRVFGVMVLAHGCSCYVGVGFLSCYYNKEMTVDRDAFWRKELRDRANRCTCKKFTRKGRCDAQTIEY